MQPVGKLDENHAYVAAHRQKHLSKAFGLGNFVGGKTEFIEFAHSVDDFRHFDAELLGHLDFGHARVFEHVVHEARADCGGIQMPLRENRCNRQRVRDVRFARLSELPEVRIIGVAEGRLNAAHIAFREVLTATRQKLCARCNRCGFAHRGVKRQVRIIGDDLIGPAVQIRFVVITLMAHVLRRNLRPGRYLPQNGVGLSGGCLGHHVLP